MGCRYGRDFMPGKSLPYKIVKNAIQDANSLGFYQFRLYGGEPLLHPDIDKMVNLCSKMKLNFCLVTNAVLLDRKIESLYEAGLRDISIGIYGIGDEYDDYVQVPGNFKRVEKSIASVRKKYGNDLNIQMNWLLRRSTCNVESFKSALNFALQYDLKMQVDLIHYSVPYFQEGPDRVLQFCPGDGTMIHGLIDFILDIKRDHPEMFSQSEQLIRSIPDWLIKGPKMKIPCTAYQMLWVAPDGSVLLCHVTFKLGNLHDQSLKTILSKDDYVIAAREAFQLKCPNCHCNSNDRILRHRPSRMKYTLH